MPKIFRILFISLFVGLVSGILSSAFLYSLKSVTALRINNPYLIFGLPLFGLVFGFIVMRIPHYINQGVPYILEELENEKAKVSTWMTPFVFLASIGSHLFGGSVGREGVGVIMGTSSAHLLPKMFKSFVSHRKILIYSGVAAGFSSIFGTPLAAIVFAFELHAFKDIKIFDLILCTGLSSFIALYTSHFLGPSHQHFEVFYSAGTGLIPYINYYKQLLTGSVDRLVFAGRYAISSTQGQAPFYEYKDSWSSEGSIEGLGGGKTLRGFKQSRFLAPLVSFINLEARWRFAQAKVGDQHFSFNLVPFVDFGKVWNNIGDYNLTNYKLSKGMGLRVPWNSRR